MVKGYLLGILVLFHYRSLELEIKFALVSGHLPLVLLADQQFNLCDQTLPWIKLLIFYEKGQ